MSASPCCAQCMGYHPVDVQCPAATRNNAALGEQPIGAPCFACDEIHRDENKSKENVVAADFGGRPYVELGTMSEEIRAVINKYALRVSLAETTGVLEIVKLELFDRAKLK